MGRKYEDWLSCQKLANPAEVPANSEPKITVYQDLLVAIAFAPLKGRTKYPYLDVAVHYKEEIAREMDKAVKERDKARAESTDFQAMIAISENLLSKADFDQFLHHWENHFSSMSGPDAALDGPFWYNVAKTDDIPSLHAWMCGQVLSKAKECFLEAYGLDAGGQLFLRYLDFHGIDREKVASWMERGQLDIQQLIDLWRHENG